MKFIMSFLVITFSMVQYNEAVDIEPFIQCHERLNSITSAQVSNGVKPKGHSHHYKGSNQIPPHFQGFAVGCGDDSDVDEPQTDGGGENSDYENEGLSQTPETTETGIGKHKSHSRTISFGGWKSLASGEEICAGSDGPEHLEGHYSHNQHHHHQHDHHRHHHHHHHPLDESKREVEEDDTEDEVRECIGSGCHHHRHPTSHSGSVECHESDDEEEDIRHPLPPTKGLLRKGAFRKKQYSMRH